MRAPQPPLAGRARHRAACCPSSAASPPRAAPSPPSLSKDPSPSCLPPSAPLTWAGRARGALRIACWVLWDAREATPLRPPAVLRSFKEGVRWLEAANRLGMTPEYADGGPGVRPPSARTLLSCLPGLQTQHQCWACSVRRSPASLVAEQGDARWVTPAALCHPRGAGGSAVL